MSLSDDLLICEQDIRGCRDPKPCESCDLLRRILDALNVAMKALRDADEAQWHTPEE